MILENFFLAYSFVVLSYYLSLYLIIVIKKKRKYPVNNKPFTVIIPCYNESYNYLKECIESILVADGEKQVILVDNNSNLSETLRAINEYKRNPRVLVLSEKRQGKRYAHSKGLKYAKNEIIVFVDSDTLVLKNSFIELIKPFIDPKIGAVGGNIRIKNRNDNILTKSLDSMYWNSFEFYRGATSSLGYLYVCSGALSAYRKELLLALEEEYLNETFLGKPCSISDDTFMTVRVQSRFGKKIVFQNRALGYTYSPNTIVGFWKQLFRWRQGFLRESINMWLEPKKHIKILFIDAQYNLITQTLMTFLKLFLIYNLVVHFSLPNLVGFCLWFVLISSLNSVYLFIYNPRDIPYIFLYSILYEFIFVFTYFHALIKIRHQGIWTTR